MHVKTNTMESAFEKRKDFIAESISKVMGGRRVGWDEGM